MGKMVEAVVIADRGVEIDESVRVLLPDAMVRRFSDAMETKTDKAGKKTAIVKSGAHVITRRITLKRGQKVMIDADTLTRVQEMEFSFEKPAKAKAKKTGASQGPSDDDLAAEAAAEWATLSDEQKATYKEEADFVGQYVEAAKKAA